MELKKEFNPVSWRPTVIGREYAVATGHYLATTAAQRKHERGGNAVDAGMTAALALAVLEPDFVSFAGVAPTLLYLKNEATVVSLAGLGHWPAATDVDRLRSEGNGCIPEGILRSVLPAVPATHIQALRRWGTISFEDAATPALELAREGFGVYPLLNHSIEFNAAKFARYPENRAVFLRNGHAPAVGSLFRQQNLARTLGRMIAAERACAGDRDAKLRAVHDCFYRGPIADEIAAFYARERGFLTKSDLETFEVPVEAAISCGYKDYTIYSCDVWCQGIVLLEALKILERIDVQVLRVNSTAYIHAIASALNLAFADREAYVGDPRFVKVPVAGLLSEDYAEHQRARLPARAFAAMPAPGCPAGAPAVDVVQLPPANTGRIAMPADTIYACVVDRHGNAYSATLSDDTHDGPMVPGMGLSISTRGSQSRLDPCHPNCAAPGKRPRLTPNPALALRNGQFYMAFGTPGGDIQTQSMCKCS